MYTRFRGGVRKARRIYFVLDRGWSNRLSGQSRRGLPESAEWPAREK